MGTRILLGGLLVGGLLLAPLVAGAGAPELVSYQGVLTLSDGTTVEDGDYTIDFAIFDDAIGGNELYRKTLVVGVKDGLYNVILSTPDAGQPLGEVFASGPQRYMDVLIQTGPAQAGVTYPILLTPRHQIASVPYALSAGEVSANVDPNTMRAFAQLVGAHTVTTSATKVTWSSGTDTVAVPDTGSWLVDVRAVASASIINLNPSAQEGYVSAWLKIVNVTDSVDAAGWSIALFGTDDTGGNEHFSTGGITRSFVPASGKAYRFELWVVKGGNAGGAAIRGRDDSLTFTANNSGPVFVEAIVRPWAE